MSRPEGISALVLPADEPPRPSSIKRLLLFFDSVTVIHPDDRAFLNNREIVEDFPGRISHVEWGEQSVFPRSEGYEDAFASLLSETRRVQERMLLQVRQYPLAGGPDPTTRMLAYAAALPKPDLVRAALPDIDVHRLPKVPDCMLFGGAVAPQGMRSRYDVDFSEPYHLPEAEAWSPLGWLRLGRSLKFLEVARWFGAAPVALDEPNQGVVLALGSQAFRPGLKPDDVATYAVSTDAVDPRALDETLERSSWDEVLAIRREVLPKVAELRTLLLKRSRRLSSTSMTDLPTYRAHLRELQKDLESAQLDYVRKWQDLRIGTLLKGVGAASLTAAGLEALLSPTSWLGVVQLLVSGLVTGGVALSSEVKVLISGYLRVRESPLCFFERLPAVVGTPRQHLLTKGDL